MSIILWSALIGYIIVAVMFNIGFLYVYHEDKEGWTESDLVNKTSMLVCSVMWPFCLLWGLYKMREEDGKGQ